MSDIDLFHVRINDDTILDAYIYAGNLICVTKDGCIKALPLKELYPLYKRHHKSNTSYYSLFEMAILRNDWFDNTQGCNFFRISNLHKEFDAAWKSFCAEPFVYNGRQWQTIAELPSMPVYDMKIYGFHIFLGTGRGLYEHPICAQDEYHAITSSGKTERKFDARVIGLSAYGGEVAISAGSEGLFHGSMWIEEESLMVNEKCYCTKSLRTHWTLSFGLLNYESNNNFSYISSKIITSKKPRLFSCSWLDDSSKKRHIDTFCDSITPMSDFLEKTKLNAEDICYAYNEANAAFFVRRSGEIVCSNALYNRTTSHTRLVPVGNIDSNDIISVIAMNSATIIEYFNKVVIYIGNNCKILSNEASISVRTFPTSRRFNKIIAITDEHGVSLYTLPSFPNITTAALYSKKQREIIRPMLPRGTE